jgi:hypothetical protein
MRTAQKTIFKAFSYKNASRYGTRFSNKFHQNKVFNIEVTKYRQCFDTVRFGVLRKISV